MTPTPLTLDAEGFTAPVSPDLDAAYTAERHGLMRQSLPLTVALYLLFVGLATAVEWVFFRSRWPITLSVYAAHVTASLVALALARNRRISIDVICVTVTSVWSLVLTAYTVVLVGLDPERFASAQICLLYGLFFMLPWAWRHQLVVSLMALLGLLAACVPMGLTVEVVYALVVVLTGTITSTGGVRFLDRYRRDDFVRRTLLERVSADQQREADVAASLLHVSETLSVNLSEPELLHSLTRVAVQAVGCDWGSTFVWDDAREAYRLGGLWGATPEVAEEMQAVEFTAATLPLIDELRPGVLVEIENAASQTLVPHALLDRWGVASQIVAPIARGDRIMGALCLAYRERRGPFSEVELRLARGISHSTTLALATLQLIEDLRIANQLRSEFVSTMSHELRTPLNVILGFAEIARDPDIDGDERRHCLQRVEVAGRELLRLIDDTLAVGRLEAGRESIDREPIDLAGAWSSIGRQCAAMCDSTDVTLRWNAVALETPVETDARKLGMIVRNLVHNAVKFTEQGSIDVDLRVQATTLVLTVSDPGIGIAPKNHEAIFEMFRQADGSDTRRYGGTGLGLYIVRRFVGQLDGTIAVDSALGRGTTFTVTLPLRPGRSLSNVA